MKETQEKTNKESGENGVHIVYKKLGETPLEALERFRRERPQYEHESLTYAGRLDPMAEGLLLVLSGDTVHEKEKYLGLSKTYEVEMVWGCGTDTADVLGMCVDFLLEKKIVPNPEKMQETIKNMVGEFEQKYPAYSSKPVLGKPLFQWAREDRLKEIEIPSHTVTLLDAAFNSRREISGSELLKNIEEKIARVKGDFRQKEIIAAWQEILDGKDEGIFLVDKMSLTVSSGFYVRQFVEDLAEHFGLIATTFHILRIQVGDFKI